MELHAFNAMGGGPLSCQAPSTCRARNPDGVKVLAMALESHQQRLSSMALQPDTSGWSTHDRLLTLESALQDREVAAQVDTEVNVLMRRVHDMAKTSAGGSQPPNQAAMLEFMDLALDEREPQDGTLTSETYVDKVQREVLRKQRQSKRNQQGLSEPLPVCHAVLPDVLTPQKNVNAWLSGSCEPLLPSLRSELTARSQSGSLSGESHNTHVPRAGTKQLLGVPRLLVDGQIHGGTEGHSQAFSSQRRQSYETSHTQAPLSFRRQSCEIQISRNSPRHDSGASSPAGDVLLHSAFGGSTNRRKSCEFMWPMNKTCASDVSVPPPGRYTASGPSSCELFPAQVPAQVFRSLPAQVTSSSSPSSCELFPAPGKSASASAEMLSTTRSSSSVSSMGLPKLSVSGPLNTVNLAPARSSGMASSNLSTSSRFALKGGLVSKPSGDLGRARRSSVVLPGAANENCRSKRLSMEYLNKASALLRATDEQAAVQPQNTAFPAP